MLSAANEEEAGNDRKEREAIVAALDAQLKKGDKALVGNSAYRRYLRKIGKAKDNRSFEIDTGKLAEEARFDGIFVLRTNAKVTPLQAALRYRDLPQVENLFLRTKAIMRTRPIFHSSDAAIRGHVFCSFLALAMQKHLGRRDQAGSDSRLAERMARAAGTSPPSKPVPRSRRPCHTARRFPRGHAQAACQKRLRRPASPSTRQSMDRALRSVLINTQTPNSIRHPAIASCMVMGSIIFFT